MDRFGAALGGLFQPWCGSAGTFGPGCLPPTGDFITSMLPFIVGGVVVALAILIVAVVMYRRSQARKSEIPRGRHAR